MLLADPAASEGENLRGNVLTDLTVTQTAEILAGQGFQGVHPGSTLAPPTYCVKDEDPEKRSGSKPKRAQRKGKKPGKRGPKGSTSLEWSQVKQVTEFWHQARTVRTPLNVFVTIRAPMGVSDAQGKRIISRSIAHLGQKLKRNDQEHVGVTVYEKGPHLHAHHLVHVRPKNLDLVMDWREGEQGDVHVRKADWFAPIYATKQRRWMGPEIEDKIGTRQGRRPWEKGAPIAGPRLTFTKEAKTIMEHRAGHAAAAAAIAYAKASEPERPVVTPATPPKPLPVAGVVAAPMQLPLFGTLPERRYLQPSDLRSFRQVRGHTQAEISTWAGIRNRSHVANFERGHDGLSLQRQRLLRHMMDTQRMAA
jgi:hypothetical protein